MVGRAIPCHIYGCALISPSQNPNNIAVTVKTWGLLSFEEGLTYSCCTGLGVFFVSFLILVDTLRLVFLKGLPLKAGRACGYRVFCDKVRI